ncbi:MAG TPA: hypothetical protein DEV93_22665 [Chloroflexi bacterium]|nr:hypothetical protein [Chloroflexota bacterium]
MIPKSLRAAIVLGTALTLMAPWVAQAKSKTTLIQGTILQSNRAVIGITGNCSCDYKWYTIGLHPGKVTVSLKMMSVALKMGPAYELKADLERRNRQIIGQGQQACWRTAKNCTLTVHFTAKIFRSQPYYLHVMGNGAEGLKYTAQVQGSIYRLK